MLPARKQGSLSYMIENQSQTRSFAGEVVECNVGAKTCLVRISGSRVQTCSIPQGVSLFPGNKVTCSRLPGSTHLVIMSGGSTVSTAVSAGAYTPPLAGGGGGGDDGNPIPPPLSAPTNLAADAMGSMSINLSWDYSGTGANYFEIQRWSGTINNLEQIASLPISETTFSDTGLLAETEYSYRVRSSNGPSLSDFSNTATATTGAPELYPPESLTAVAVSDTEVQLDWVGVDGRATMYEVWISADNSRYMSRFRTAEISKLDHWLAAGTTYWYKIRALNNTECSTLSAAVEVTTLTPTLAAPTGLTAACLSPTEINTQWLSVLTRVTKFQVWYGLDGVDFNPMPQVDVSVLSTVVGSLLENTLYYFYVRALNDTECSPPSAVVSAMTLAVGLTTPTNPAAVAISESEVQVSWDSTDPLVEEFHIWRSLDGETYTIAETVTADLLTYLDTGLTENTLYFYYVTAASTTLISEPSEIVTVTTMTVGSLATPTGLMAWPMSDTEIELFWTEADTTGVSHFRLWRKLGSGTYRPLPLLPVSILTLINTGLLARTAYTYIVRAVNPDAGVISLPSNAATATTLSLTLDAPINLTALALDDTEIQLNWELAGERVEHFQIRRSQDNITFERIANVDATVLEYHDLELDPATTYWYLVRAFNTTEISPESEVADATTDTASVFHNTAVLDSFSRANGVLGTSWGGDGSAWTGEIEYFSTDPGNGFNILYPAVIRSSKFAAPLQSPGNYSSLYGGAFRNASYGPDCECYATLGSIADSIQLFVRAECLYNNSSAYALNGYLVDFTFGGGLVQVQLRTESFQEDYTVIGTTDVTASWATGDLIGLAAIGDTITVYHKASGSDLEIVLSVTDTTYTGSGKIGARVAQDAALSSFGGGAL